MLPAPLCLSACGSEHVTRTLVRACQGLRLSNHWSGSITTHELSTVLSRRRDRDAIRNACSLVCHTHAGTLKHTTSPTTHMSARSRTSVEIVRRRCRLDARAVTSRAVSSLARGSWYTNTVQMCISTWDCSRIVAPPGQEEIHLARAMDARSAIARSPQSPEPPRASRVGRWPSRGSVASFRPSRIDRTIPTSSRFVPKWGRHPFRGLGNP